MAGLRPGAELLLAALLSSLWPAGRADEHGPHEASGRAPRVHFVAYMTRVSRLFDVFGTSAESHGLHPQVVGYSKSPEALGAKINALRGFVKSRVVKRNDVVVFVGELHAMVFAGEEEILQGLAEMEKTRNASIFFSAVPSCSPAIDGLCEDYPHSPTPWRYLSSSLFVGRAWAIRGLLREPVDEAIDGGDQAWYQRQFRQSSEHSPVALALDVDCRLLCTVVDADPGALALGDGGRMVRRDTGDQPVVVSFPGAGHGMRWDAGLHNASSNLLDTFHQVHPEVARRVVDEWKLELHIGSTHDIKIYGGSSWWNSLAVVMCVRCNVLLSEEPQCRYFNGFFGGRCWLWNFLAFIFLVALPACQCFIIGRVCLRGGRMFFNQAMKKRQGSKPAD